MSGHCEDIDITLHGSHMTLHCRFDALRGDSAPDIDALRIFLWRDEKGNGPEITKLLAREDFHCVRDQIQSWMQDQNSVPY